MFNPSCRHYINTLLFSCLLAGVMCSATPTAASPHFTDPKQVLHWIDGYRLNKAPDQVPAMVRTMARLGMLRRHNTAGLYIGFIAGFIADNQTRAEALIKKMFPLKPIDQGALIKAIAYSGLPNWKDILGRFVERMPARKVLIQKYLYGDGKTLFALPLRTGPHVIDTLWGYFFATGSDAPVLRILSALSWSNEKQNLEKLTVGSMAKWTMAANARRHDDLLSFYKIQLGHQPAAIRKPLHDIVTAVETYETWRVRKQAIAAVETLKRQGPQKQTTWSRWASRAGQTLLAVGCVVAGATGHPEIAVPCVITGAVYSGASTLWNDWRAFVDKK